MAGAGLLRGRAGVPLKQALGELDRYSLPRHIESSMQLFADVRNQIVHGHGASEASILSAIDSGIAILRAIQAIPRETITVLHAGVQVYSDAAALHALPDVVGVMLQATSPGGASQSVRIYPTTQTHFTQGKRVAWEWDNTRTFRRARYRDPRTSEILLVGLLDGVCREKPRGSLISPWRMRPIYGNYGCASLAQEGVSRCGLQAIVPSPLFVSAFASTTD